MLRVGNQWVVRQVAKTTWKGNKKRNLLTIFAITLTSFLLTAVISMGLLYWRTVFQRNKLMEGIDYDLALTEPREEQTERAREMERISAAGVMVKCAMTTAGEREAEGKVRLYWTDKECWEKQCLPAFEGITGEYPKRENEILLSERGLKALGIENPRLGQRIDLTYYCLEEYEEKKEGSVTEEFVLSGYFSDYSGSARGFVSQAFYEKSGVRQTDYTQGYLYLSFEHSFYTAGEVQELVKRLELADMQVLMGDEEAVTRFVKIGAGLLALLLMILGSGALFIYNTLYLSVAKDVRYYGQLKTLGMTSKQLKGVIYRQAVFNSCAGIPVGLLLGTAVAYWIAPGVIQMINPGAGGELMESPAVVLVFSGVFSAAAVFLSAGKPAAMAGECSLIEAMRYSGGKARGCGKKRENGLRGMARRNIFRDRKQAAVILGSFLIALALYETVLVVVREYDAKNVLNTLWEQDMRILNNTALEEDLPLLSEEKIEELRSLPGVKAVRAVTASRIGVPYQEEVFGEYYRSLYHSRFTPGNYEEDISAYQKDFRTLEGRFGSELVGIDGKGIEKLEQALGEGFDREAFERGEIALVDNWVLGEVQDAVGKTVRFSVLEGEQAGKSYEVKLAGSMKTPSYFARGGYTPALIVSQEFAERVLGETFTELLELDYEAPYSMETEARVKEAFAGEEKVSFESKLDSYEEMKATEVQVKVLGNGLGVILAALALLNYLNLITAGIQSRRKELAALESIGMTRRQIRRVLAQEGSIYAILSIVLGLSAGIPVSLGVFQSANVYGVAYEIPAAENFLLFGLIFLLCAGLPPMVYESTQKGNVLERLRRE